MLFDQYQPTAGYEDSRGHFWVARLGLGLVEWIPDSTWQRWFAETFSNEHGLSVTRTRDGAIVAATHAAVYRLDNDEWVRLSRESREYDYLFPVEDGRFAASIRGIGLAWLTRAGALTGQAANPFSSARDFRKIIRDTKGRLWVGTKLGLLLYDGGRNSLREVVLPSESPPSTGVADLEMDSAGRLWAGYSEGIAWLDEQDQWHRVPTSAPVRLVRSFTLAGGRGNDIWVAYREADEFSRLQKRGEVWEVQEFTPAGGFGPPDTHFLKHDSRGWIWRGSTDGVHVCDGVHTGPGDWIHIRLANGLAADTTDQFGFFEDRDGSIWLSGEEGLSHLRPDARWFAAPIQAGPPRLTRVRADDREIPPGSALPTGASIVVFEIGSMNAPRFRDSPFRYRLLPLFTDWKTSSDGTLAFRNLARREYRFEVGYAGDPGTPGLSMILHVGSNTAIPWTWLWPFAAGTAMLGWLLHTKPWMQRLLLTCQHTLFLLRRRFGGAPLSSGAGTVAPDRSDELVGGRYRLVRPISRGGFSVVYEALDIRDNRRAAVKILNRNSNVDEGWIRERFAHEVAALSSIHHPGVVPVLDSWIESDGAPCLTMPFLEGETLESALRAGPFPPVEAAGVIREVAEALSTIHERGIVHRDLKPENVMLVADAGVRRAVLIDFGAAGLRSGPDSPTTTTVLTGSFHYMAPERLVGRYSPATDMYGLGVIALELLTGKRLLDLSALVTDENFRSELASLLESAVGHQAERVAAHLAPAYAANPAGRPRDLRLWSNQLQELIDSTF